MRDEFRIDAVTGQVVSAERYADKTFGEKIIASVLDIHRGAFLGWPGKLAFMIAAALMPLFSVTGVLLVSVAPQAAASGAAAARAACSGRVSGRQG